MRLRHPPCTELIFDKLYRVAIMPRMPSSTGCFRKRAAQNRALLQEMTYKDVAFYASSPPCSRLGEHARTLGAHRTSDNITQKSAQL